MLLKVENLHKSIGIKDLFEDLNFIVNEGDKIGLIGRNGLGKTTLFRILTGEDKEYKGNLEIKNGLNIVMTQQEHFFDDDIISIDYVLDNVPKYRELQNTIRLYESKGEVSLESYCDAINEFSESNYFSLEGKIVQSLIDFQITEEAILSPMSTLSGGEKRFVELVRVMYSNADIALIDEPTNHMDYVGKERFQKWFREFDKTIIVITHDRDVLKEVSKVIELKDKKIFNFKGNYDAYIKQNSLSAITGIDSYELSLKQMEGKRKQMLEARTMKLKAKSDKGRIQAKRREERFQAEYDRVKESLSKPSLWIDKNSLQDVSSKVVDSYHKYKEKNINITNSASTMHKKLLLSVRNLSLGYESPLFSNLNFQLFYGDKVFIKGRNGAGKSTLVKKLISQINELEDSKSQIFKGDIKLSLSIKVGIYEQEVDQKYIKMTLGDAITDLYYQHNIPINNEKLNSILKKYLFSHETDLNLTFDKLSGGQKARFQLIKMFVNEPNLLILDEPTNHLDLPSIEELENALNTFHGGIIYISHDSYFIEVMGGEVVEIKT